MFPTAFLLLSLVSVVTPTFVSDFELPFLYQCPSEKSIASWESYHNNYYEDRSYSFTCQTTPELGNCQWHGYVNKFEEPISFRCPLNDVIIGISSFYNNYFKDRRFKFNCCSLKGKQLVHCSTTRYVSRWDERFRFRVPGGYFLKGVSSIHSNYYEDRRWKFETCLIN